jgi:hypothetical protein
MTIVTGAGDAEAVFWCRVSVNCGSETEFE